jgi:hypothetical protein
MNFKQQSTINTNSLNNLNKMSSSNQVTSASANASDNIQLYIPRASLKTTEYQVKNLFFQYCIGTVEYCDLVVIKDKETKQPLYMSIFLKLDTWNPFSDARADFIKLGSLKLRLSKDSDEFWMILPNKNPLPRSHVNTTQLAASTEKLFEQTEKIVEQADKFKDEMRAEMAEMRLFIKLQQEKIEMLEFRLAETENDLNAKIEEMIIWGVGGGDDDVGDQKNKLELADLDDDSQLPQLLPPPPMSRIPTRDYGHTAEDEYQELMANQLLPPPPALTRNNARDFDDDCEELLANQLLQLPTQPPRLCRTASVAFNEDDACIFALKQQQRRSPVEVHTGSPPKPQTLVDIVAENPHRAIVSRDYCGNL